MKKSLPLLILLLILLLAAFLRLYRISDYMTFLGDEGRDVLVAKHMLEGQFTLLGPRSSAGDFFMGPIYYYMITPFLWLYHLDPVGPAVMVALFGVATVFLIYFVGKKFFNERAGLFAAALYTVSPIVISYSRSSWNPNVLPFFSLLLIYFLYLAVKEKSWKKFVFSGFLLGIALQLHYLALFLGVIAAVYIFGVKKIVDKSVKVSDVVRPYGQVFLGFLLGLSPFLAFEVRHSFLNTRAIMSFIFGGQKGPDVHNTPFFSIVGDVFFRIFAKLVFFFPPPEWYDKYNPSVLTLFGLSILVIAVAGVVFLFRTKNTLAKLILGLWLILGVLFFGFYKKSIYDYHFAFLFPLPFLLVGNFLSHLYEMKRKRLLMVSLGTIIFLGIFFYNFSGMPFRYEPNRQKNQVKQITEFVIAKSAGKPFNFAIMSGGNSDHAYRYYFEILGREPVSMENTLNDPQRKTVTDQLLIVCEDTSCHPLGAASFEIAGFGRAEIAAQWDVSVVKVYKLAHYKEKK